MCLAYNAHVMSSLILSKRTTKKINVACCYCEWCFKSLLIYRLVYDRETGKPKGYGFCEYQDTETAQSALRNLNNHDFNGRPLRVGVAAGEGNKDEMQGMQQALGGPVLEVSIYKT